MTEFDERLEGEMKTHEKEMLKKVIVQKYGSKDLTERILYIMTTYPKDSWSANEMYAKLSEVGIHGTDSVDDVKNLFNGPENVFPSKVSG
jgi:hypothetical protein